MAKSKVGTPLSIKQAIGIILAAAILAVFGSYIIPFSPMEVSLPQTYSEEQVAFVRTAMKSLQVEMGFLIFIFILMGVVGMTAVRSMFPSEPPVE